MWNPLTQNKITLTVSDVIHLLGQKEAELQIARSQIQQALRIIDGLKAQITELTGSAKTVPNARIETGA